MKDKVWLVVDENESNPFDDTWIIIGALSEEEAKEGAIRQEYGTYPDEVVDIKEKNLHAREFNVFDFRTNDEVEELSNGIQEKHKIEAGLENTIRELIESAGRTVEERKYNVDFLSGVISSLRWTLKMENELDEEEKGKYEWEEY